MNTEHTQYLEWLDLVESYYKDSLLRVLEHLPTQYEEYTQHLKEESEADLLLKEL